MNNQQAKDLVMRAFTLIEKAESIEALKGILNILNIPKKNQMDITGYPKINFTLNSNEIEHLIETGFINSELDIHNGFSVKNTTPLERLFYAVLWKNGDLKKVKHIIKGIKDNEDRIVKEGIVFHQFGRFLTGKTGEPIIDQHVIRAFAVYENTDDKDIDEQRELEVLNKKHQSLILNYKKWLNGSKISEKLKKESDYCYHVDQLLFAIGKTIKKRIKR
ncbi:MAG: hypothetical protein LBE37_16780 [Sphingobacterium sp.]|jgi:hypothetical protein|nr:hypothetical protein [Sphingobacterium sp.]